MNIIRHIPNTITCMNLLCGCIAISLSMQGHPETAAYFIFVAALFDFLDGMSARLLQAYSELGKQLDSLADVVSFGVAPGTIVYSMLVSNLGDNNLAYVAFLIPVFSALRLAKFNIDTNQKEDFIGLPTPAMGIFVASLPLAYEQVRSPYLFALIILLSGMMVSPLPLFSLKFKSLQWSANLYRYILLILAAVLFSLFNFAAIPAIVFLYVLLSVIRLLVSK